METNPPIAFPTPYVEVNTILIDLQSRIRVILGSQFVGMYLYGSLALGDFDPQISDVDTIVVTQSELTDELIHTLRAMHIEFDRSGSPWAGKVEAAYIPLDALKVPAPAATSYPQIERGAELFLAPLEPGWAFQRWTLRERGVVVAGPNPAAFTTPVDRAEMQQAAAGILSGWQEQAGRDPEWIAWVRLRSSQAFVVLTTCRLWYSVSTGSVASKPAAARWAEDALGYRWKSFIQRALVGQQDGHEISEIELEETIDFINEAVERIRN